MIAKDLALVAVSRLRDLRTDKAQGSDAVAERLVGLV
jgi:hypothetical protein